MRRVATIDLAGGSGSITTGLGSVWVTNDESGAVVRIDPQQEAVLRTYDVGGQPFGVAVGAGAVWVASDTGGLARIDPVTDDVGTIAIGGAPRNVAFAPGGVWISVD
jgi:YVTN family beta-propeller protein